MRSAIAYGLASAALFGASTPLAKLLAGEVSPVLLAGLLYLGSGLGLLAWLGLRSLAGARAHSHALEASDYPWLAGAIVCGGMLAPALLVLGLGGTSGATASLLLNLEAVFTAVLAWLVFRENAGRRVLLGMAGIVAGGGLLAWQEMPTAAASYTGPLLIAGACIAWAVDNNLTRRVSGGDAALIACLKGLVAGAANLVLALGTGAAMPPLDSIAAAGVVGFFGYGISLVLFIMALRHLGAARTGAYFAVAPFFGAALAILLLHEAPPAIFWVAAVLMALGVWLHATERHVHVHTHEAVEHTHEHDGAGHHREQHRSGAARGAKHVHAHRHERVRHQHPHYPDLDHRHSH